MTRRSLIVLAVTIASLTLIAADARAQFTEQYAGTFAGVQGASVKWGDIDNDGLLDLVVSGRDPANGYFTQVYQNTGSGFTAISSGLPAMLDGSIDLGDYDNDGDLDVLMSGYYSGGPYAGIYQNNGGTFTEVYAGQLATASQSSVAWVDYDNDGRLDAFVSGFTGAESRSRLYRNTGIGFTEVYSGTFQYMYSGAAAWGDYDNDGLPDLVLTGRDNAGTPYTRLYHNTGSGFTSVSHPFPGVSESSVAWGDYDNDGDLDLLITGSVGISGIRSRLFQNSGGTFTQAFGSETFTDIFNGSASWGDFDNDGKIDVVMTSYYALDSCRVYRNTGSGFTRLTGGAFLPLDASASAWADYDGDGDLDVVITGEANGATRYTKLFRNDGSTFNTIPSAPTGLAVSVNNGLATLSWSAATDSQTPSPGLNYDIVVGTSSGLSDKVTPPANLSNGFRRVARIGRSSTNAATISGLTTGQPYYWKVQAVDGAFAGSAFSSEASFTPAAQPTVQSSSLQFTSVLHSSMTLQWTNGNGSNRLVVLHQGSPVDTAPSDGLSATANTAFGTGTQIGTGNYVVYAGTGSSVAVSGLNPNTTYYAAVYEFNGTGGGQNYLTTSAPTGSQSTADFPVALYAISFDGTDDYVSVPTSSALDLTTGTIELWMKPQWTAGTRGFNPALVANRSAGATRFSLNIKDDLSRIDLYNGTSTGSANYTFTQDTWYHIAAVTSGASTTFYVNGVNIGTAAVGYGSSTGLPFEIGSDPSDELFKGTIDEVRIWNTARTQSELQSSYGKLTGSESGLVAYYRFDEGTGTSAADATGNGHGGTLTNGPTWVESGVMLGAPTFHTDKLSLAFGTVDTGTVKQDSVVITNDGSAILNINAVASTNARFIVTPSSAAIDSLSQQKFYVTFHPTVAGALSGKVTFTSNAGTSPDSVTYTGLGLAPPQFSASANSVNLGTAPLGTAQFDSVIITNTGGSDLTISSATVATLNFFVFASSTTIPAGESAALYVGIIPGATGTLQDTVTVVHDATGSPKKIALSGVGAVQSVSAVGGAIVFSGSGTVATGLTNLGGSELTIEYWFKGTNVQSAIRQQGSDYIVAGWSNPPIHILSNDGGTGSGLGMGNVNDDQWHHVAMTWKQNTVNGFKSYLDGTIVAQRTSGNTPIPNMSTTTYIGSYIGAGEFTVGRMDEVRIWSVARPADSIRYYMNRPLAGNEAGLAGYWRMNDSFGTRVVDATGHGYTGTASNNSWADSDARIPGAAMILSATSIAYGSILTGSTKADSIVVTNPGPLALPISSIVSSPAEMTISVADADSVIAAGDSSKVYLTFAPTTAGAKNGTLTISAGSTHPPVYVSWTATATAAEPTAQGTGFTYGEGIRSMTLHFTAGDGDGRLILMHSAAAVNANPADFTAYTANANFGSGSQIGTGNYVVYAGSGDSVVVTGLTPGTTYSVAMFEYNGAGSGINYLTTSAPTGSHAAYQPDLTHAGTGLVFNGNTDGSGTSVTVGGGTISFGSTMTLEAWVKWDGTAGYKVVVGRARLEGGSSLNSGIALALNNGAPFAIFPRSAYNYESYSTSTGTTLSANVWTHVSYVVNAGSGSATLYVNGGNVGSTGYSPTSIYNSSAQTMYIGKEFSASSPDRCFPGALDEVRIWTVARSQSQIQAGMHEPLTGTESGLQAYYQFNEASGSTAYDSISARHGTISNAYSRTNTSILFGPSTTLNSVQSGVQTLSNVTLTLTDDFDNPVNLTLRKHLGFSSVIPGDVVRMVGSEYYNLSASGTPGTYRSRFSVTLGSGQFDPLAGSFPGDVKLYQRSGPSETDTWSFVTSSDSVDVASGTAWFPDSVTSMGEYIVVEDNTALSVTLASFSASASGTSAELKWRTVTEEDNTGWEVERRQIADLGPRLRSGQELRIADWEAIGFVQGAGTSTAPREYSFNDAQVAPGRYAYRLKQIDQNGAYRYSAEYEVAVGIAPRAFALSQNYPNPFNPTTTIEFSVAEDGPAALKVFDLLGREAATLLEGEVKAGFVQQVTFDATRFASGVYIVRLESNKMKLTRKVVLMK